MAAEALLRLAREVDRLSVALEPVRAALPLRDREPWREIVVERQVARASAEPMAADRPARTPAPEPAPEPVPPPEPVPVEPIALTLATTAANEDPSSPSATPLTPGIAQVTRLRARLEPQLTNLRAGAAWEQAEDPIEAIHRLRVATRRLRAFVRLCGPMLARKRAERLRTRLRSITRGIGELREWDVLLEALRAEHRVAEPLPRAALEHVIEWAEAPRRKAARAARKALAGVDLEGLAQALDGELDRVCGRMLRLDAELPEQAATLLEPELARAFDGMPTPHPELDIEALHELRIRAKRLRYALELLEPSLGESDRALRRPLKRIQSALGDHRDAVQLGDRLRERREALAARGLQTLACALEPIEAKIGQAQQAALERAQPALARLGALVEARSPAASAD